MIDDNVVVLHEKPPYESQHTLAFTHRAMLLEGKLTPGIFALDVMYLMTMWLC